MVAIETGLRRISLREIRYDAVLVLAPVTLAAAVTVGSLVEANGPQGWEIAADLVWRGGAFLFVLALVVVPFLHLVPRAYLFGRIAPGLTMGFAGVYAIFLGCLAAPDLFGLVVMPFAEGVFCVVGGCFAIAYAASAGRTGRIAHAIHRLAAIYFWWAYLLPSLDHLVGPHRPDGYFGLCALLMVGALLVCFAGDLAGVHRASPLSDFATAQDKGA